MFPFTPHTIRRSVYSRAVFLGTNRQAFLAGSQAGWGKACWHITQ